ncbi:MAG: translation initiation factor IF-2 N-terminal domain-containing protein, partial [Candidatus Omnitrophota bacterium]
MKISQLAKTIKVPSKELFIQVAKLGIPVKSVQSTIPEKNIDKLITSLKKKFSKVNWDDIDIEAIKAKSKEMPKKVAAKPKKKVVEKKAVKVAAKKKVTKKKPEEETAKTVGKSRVTAKKKVSEEKPVKEKKKLVKEPKEVPVDEKKEQVSVKEEVVVEATEEKAPEKKPTKLLKIKCPVAVKELALKLATSPGQIIKLLMSKGILATINQLLNEEDAKIVGEEFGYIIERLPTVEEEETLVHEEPDREEDL